MGKHKEWRKIAKKMRRKRIRSKFAKIRDDWLREEEERRQRSPGYAARLEAERFILQGKEEEERRKHDEEQRRWEEEERRVQEETKLRKALIEEMERAREKRKKEREEEIKKKKQAEKEKRERFKDYIYQFALGERSSLPAEMLIPSETQPGKEVCPFFSKVGACRFWDSCSRNHIRPALSHTLLFPGFYAHFSLDKINQGEYDTDMSLEYDDKETYAHFLEFYRDIRYEFESCGRLTNLVVCCNPEPHLRGHVYVSYATEKETMKAYLKFNGRYYGGKQLSPEFITIPSWKTAICGLFFRKKCPKGNNCNFLHIFRDPGPPFYEVKNERKSSDDWRWSESPERTPCRRSRSQERRRRSKSKERKRTGRGRSRERRSRSRERRSRSKERRSRSKERRVKAREASSSSEHKIKAKGSTSESNEPRIKPKESRSESKERTIRSNDKRGRSKERRDRSVERKTNSRKKRSRSKRRKSRSKS